jgi:two-component system, cell cycle sensor histidine kinase and response regulator CckA
MIENTPFASHADVLACVAQESNREDKRLGPSRTAGTVLMIDDNEVLRSAVSRLLRTEGFRVLEAEDGRSGVDLFQVHEAIDVIVLDLNLPRLSGREAMRELQQIRPGVKVILTTTFSKDIALTALGGLFPWGYIQKPYLLSELVDALQKACKTGQ